MISAFSFGAEPGSRTQRTGGGIAAVPMRSNGGGETGGGVVRKAMCCVPGRPCQFYGEPIRPYVDEGVVRVECSNEACRESGWVHGECFETWERTLLAHLRSCGRARQWTTEKQRSQNLWTTKKAYDFVRPACACRCGSGFVRKDLSYVPGADQAAGGEDDRRAIMKHRRRSEPTTSRKCHQFFPHLPTTREAVAGAAGLGPCFDPLFRSRTVSMSSEGSSPPHSASSDSSSQSSQESDETVAAVLTTPPPPFLSKAGLFSAGRTAVAATTGNIFRHRNDFNAFRDLPVALRNPYHMKLEDEGQFGNDETRSLILVTLSVQNVTAVDCVLCGHSMPVFDKYPLVDGTFFLSPRRYNTDLRVRFHHHHHGGGGGGAGAQKHQYMNAVCFRCMIGSSGRTLQCRFCRTKWNGSTLVIGSMYAYDVFAAMSCCAAHRTCSGCRRCIVGGGVGGGPKMQFFSDYSRCFVCPHCGKEDHHFVKPIDEFYSVV